MIFLAQGKTRKVYLHENSKWVVKVNALRYGLVRNPAIRPDDNFNRMEAEIWRNAPVKDYLMPVVRYEDDLLVMVRGEQATEKDIAESPGVAYMRSLSDEAYYQQEVVRPGNWMWHEDRVVMIDYAMPELHRIWT